MEDDYLEPVAVVPPKRPRTLNWKWCIFCQKDGKNVSQAGEQGLERVTDAFKIRLHHSPDEVVQRLKLHITDLASKTPVWHKTCYASFTSKHNLEAIEKTHSDETASAAIDQPTEDDDTKRITRTEVVKVDWTKCIFCQGRKRERVIQVQSLEVHSAIHKAAKRNPSLKCRIGENDLVAYEAHYHKSCKYKAEKTTVSTSVETEKTVDIAWSKLLEILDFGFDQGHVFSTESILIKYNNLLAEYNYTDKIRADKLKMKLCDHYGDQIIFQNQRNPNKPSLVYPAWTVSHSVETLKNYTEAQTTQFTSSRGCLGPGDYFLLSTPCYYKA